MEPRPGEPEKYSEFTPYERSALTLYDEASTLFNQLNVTSSYEVINNRYMSMTLPLDYLQDINQILEANVIDPIDSMDTVILGFNPFKTIPYKADRGALWINLRQDDLVNSYSIWLNKSLNKPINATRDLFRINPAELQVGEPYDARETLNPTEVIYSNVEIGSYEQKALHEIIHHLTNVTAA